MTPIDDEDVLFWRSVVQNVVPIPHVSVIGSKSAPKIRINEHRYYAVRQEFSTYSKALEDMEFGGIDRTTLRKFKKEEFAIEAVLDLHGLTEDEAFVKVDEFIPRCFAQGKRCVVIVTGKGYHQAEDDIFAMRGVLRHQVPQWLNLPRLRAMIMIYKHPSERMGGNGALYILLKRKKSF